MIILNIYSLIDFDALFSAHSSVIIKTSPCASNSANLSLMHRPHISPCLSRSAVCAVEHRARCSASTSLLSRSALQRATIASHTASHHASTRCICVHRTIDADQLHQRACQGSKVLQSPSTHRSVRRIELCGMRERSCSTFDLTRP